MFDFIVKYWLQELFALLLLGVGVFFKIFWNLVKSEFKHQQDAFLKSIDTKIEAQQEKMIELLKEQEAKSIEGDNHLKKEIAEFKKSFDVTKKGILSVQGRSFKADCRKLLEPGHVISLNEFETITMDHNVYNSLGGNHEGDGLYDLVQTKYNNGLHNN